jgi:hypothetical protein
MPQLVPRKQKVEKPVIPTHDPLAPVSKPQAYKNTQVSMKTTTGGSRSAHQPEVHTATGGSRGAHQMEDDSSDEELSLQSIVRDKPSPSKVAMFLQECINEMNKDSDDEGFGSQEEDMMSSEYDTDRSRRKYK